MAGLGWMISCMSLVLECYINEMMVSCGWSRDWAQKCKYNFSAGPLTRWEFLLEFLADVPVKPSVYVYTDGWKNQKGVVRVLFAN